MRPTPEPTEPSKAFTRARGNAAAWSPQIQKAFDRKAAEHATRDTQAEADYQHDRAKRAAKRAKHAPTGTNPETGTLWPKGIPLRPVAKPGTKGHRWTKGEARKAAAKTDPRWQRIKGTVKTPRKANASRQNLEKARAARWPKATETPSPTPGPTTPVLMLDDPKHPSNIMTLERLERTEREQAARLRTDSQAAGAAPRPAPTRRVCACHDVPEQDVERLCTRTLKGLPVSFHDVPYTPEREYTRAERQYLNNLPPSRREAILRSWGERGGYGLMRQREAWGT
jgi:hypothetical protein